MSTTAPEAEKTSTLQEAIDRARETDGVIVEKQEEVEEPKDRSESEIDDIEIQVANREWRVAGKVSVQRGPGATIEEAEFERTYVQKPLSFISMMQFTGMIGEKIQQVMSGPDGLTIDRVVSENADLMSLSGFSRDDFSSVDAFVKGLARLAVYVPEIIGEAQCIWLQIPLRDRPMVQQIWARSPEDGGLTASEGQEMLELFLAQNYEEVEAFFVERLPRLLALVRKLRQRNSRRSKR